MLLLLAGVMGSLFVQRLQTRRLLDLSTRLTNTSEWMLPAGADVAPYETYNWVSNDTVLYFVRVGEEGEVLAGFNVRTGRETRYLKVSRWWNNDGNYKKQIEVSPDGHWVIWDAGYGDDHDYHQIQGARLDSSGHFTVPRLSRGMDEKAQTYEYCSIEWLPDSRTFTEVGVTTPVNSPSGAKPRQDCGWFRSIDHPQIAVPIRTPSPYTDPHDWTRLPSGKFVSVEVGPPGAQPANDWPPKSFQLAEIAPGSNKPASTWTISLQKNLEYEDMAISPQGDQIAWLLTAPQTSLWDRLVARLWPRHQVVAQHITRLMVSDLHGKNWTEIGRIILPPEGSDEAESWMDRAPNELKWLPDGKHVSYIYRHELKSVPVD
jgi:hypothetical protein